jgi:hypothetical protein
MRRIQECSDCRRLEQAHDNAMENYIAMVERQSRLFRQGYRLAGRDLDAEILRLKMRQQAAIDSLLAHEAEHWVKRVPLGEETEDSFTRERRSA